jgi:hypothetical protein
MGICGSVRASMTVSASVIPFSCNSQAVTAYTSSAVKDCGASNGIAR